MITNFKTISLSHKTAPLEIRELVALDDEGCRQLIGSIKDYCVVSDILIVSTCNRTEIYYSAQTDYSSQILFLLGVQKGIFNIQEYLSFFDIINDHDAAVYHLFAVSIGLESQVIGDMQIENQVKRAYQCSADLDVAGPFLHRLMHTIFFTHKKVVQSTSFRDGAASVSYATVELAESLCTELPEPKILIIGLGEMGRDVLLNLTKTSFNNIVIANRTNSKAEELAQKCGVQFIPYNQIWNAIQEADVIISSVSKSSPLITKQKIDKLNILSYKYFIDLSVPRSVAFDVEENQGIIVYNIDHIKNKTNEALEKRMAAIPLVRQLIEASIVELKEWSKEMEFAPVINRFKNALEQIRQQEVARYIKTMTETESEKIEIITKSIIQKVIKFPVLELKAACKRGESEQLSDMLSQLFDLKEANSDKVPIS